MPSPHGHRLFAGPTEPANVDFLQVEIGEPPAKIYSPTPVYNRRLERYLEQADLLCSSCIQANLVRVLHEVRQIYRHSLSSRSCIDIHR